MTYTHYCWGKMLNGEILRGMYSRSQGAATPDIARLLAKPIGKDCDAYALLRVETTDQIFRGEVSRRLLTETVLEIIPRVA